VPDCTLPADALKLVARKLQSSLAVEGELPEDGLAAYGDDGDDLMLALARKIVNGEEDEAETVEAVFAAARHAAPYPVAQLLLDCRVAEYSGECLVKGLDIPDAAPSATC